MTLVLATGGVGGAAPAPRPDELVDLTSVIPDAVIDLRYATDRNFTGVVLYPAAVCKLRRAVAERLAKAAARLRDDHRRLLVWDCYRPRSIQAVLWERMPDPRYVANPKLGSKHSRGAAIDLAVVDELGAPVTLPTEFDEFSAAAHRDHALAGDPGVEARRLDAAMRAAGFRTIPTEWWHYDAPDDGKYPLSDEPL